MPIRVIIFLIILLVFVSMRGNNFAFCSDAVPIEDNEVQQNTKKTGVSEQSTELLKNNSLEQSLKKANRRGSGGGSNTLIDISTASSQGVYYPIGSNICRLINHNRNKLNMDCRVLLSAGSFRNLQLLSSGDVDFAVVQSDFARDAMTGSGLFETFGPNNKLRLIATLHDEPLVIIVRNESNIKSLDDITGKVINLGDSINTNVKKITDLIFKAKNWNKDSFKRITNFSIDELPDALCNKYTDVMVLIAGTPNKIVQKVAELCEVKILEVADPAVLGAIQNDNVFIKTFIPGGVYFGAPKDINTIGVKAMLLTEESTDSDVVYKVTKTIVENIKYLEMIIKALANTKIVRNTLSMQDVIPLHQGSLKFYTEENKQ